MSSLLSRRPSLHPATTDWAPLLNPLLHLGALQTSPLLSPRTTSRVSAAGVRARVLVAWAQRTPGRLSPIIKKENTKSRSLGASQGRAARPRANGQVREWGDFTPSAIVPV